MLHGVHTSLLKRLFKRGIDPNTTGASAGHHVCQSSNCSVMEAFQHIPHGISQSPRFTTKKQHSLHHRLAKHAKDPGVSTLSVEKLGELVPFVTGPPEVSMQGPPIRVSASFLPP